MASAIVGAMYDPGARPAMTTLVRCLHGTPIVPFVNTNETDEERAHRLASVDNRVINPSSAKGPVLPVPTMRMVPIHEDVRRCLVSVLGNMALMEQQGMAPNVPRSVPGTPTALRELLQQAGVVAKVREALPTGAHPVHRGTYASVYARDALIAAMM